MVREEELVAVKEAADAVPWMKAWGWESRIGGGDIEGEDTLISAAKSGAKEVPV